MTYFTCHVYLYVCIRLLEAPFRRTERQVAKPHTGNEALALAVCRVGKQQTSCQKASDEHEYAKKGKCCRMMLSFLRTTTESLECCCPTQLLPALPRHP